MLTNYLSIATPRLRVAVAWAMAVAFIGFLQGMIVEAGAADAAPRPVTPRGELAADEKATIELFEKSRNSVVFISTRTQVQDFWSRNIFPFRAAPAQALSGTIPVM